MKIEHIYAYIEEDRFLNSTKRFAIINEIDHYIQNENNLSKELLFKFKVEMEVLYLQFDLQNNEFKSIADKNIPNSDELLSYLNARIQMVKNPIYRFKYYYLFYLFDSSDRKVINQGIQSYFDFVQLLFSQNDLKDKGQIHQLNNKILGLLFISKQYHYLLQESICLIGNYIDKLQLRSSLEVLKYIVFEVKNYRAEKELMYNSLSEVYTLIQNTEELKTKEQCLELLRIIYKRLYNKENEEFNNSLGEFNLLTVDKVELGLQKAHFLDKALGYFSNAKNDTMREVVLLEIQKNKKNIKFGYISNRELLSPQISDWLNHMELQILDFLNKSADYAYNFLQTEKSCLFPLEKLEKDYKLSSNLGLSTLFPNTFYDINYNIDNRGNKSIFNSAQFYLDNISYRIIKYIFYKGVLDNVLNAKTFIEYMKNNCWFGDIHKEHLSNVIFSNKQWVELLTPPVLLFFDTFKNQVEGNAYNHNNYILVIDSIGLKFEGILREFVRLNGSHGLSVKEESIKENISIEGLLKHDKIVNVIDTRDQYLFEFVFTKKGYDVRNNIAHSFYNCNDYTEQLSMMLLICILRIGNYHLESK